jgi:hypothetical protein
LAVKITAASLLVIHSSRFPGMLEPPFVFTNELILFHSIQGKKVKCKLLVNKFHEFFAHYQNWSNLVPKILDMFASVHYTVYIETREYLNN